LITCPGSGWPSDRHNPNASSQLVLSLANNLAQSPAHAISHYGVADSFRRHKASAKSDCFGVSLHTDDEQTPAMRVAGLFDESEFRGTR
jgi:hypothetical protein